MEPAGVILRDLFDTALAAAMPDGRFAGRLPPPVKGTTVVMGGGKAAASMARAFEAAWDAERPGAPLDGLVVTRYGHGAPTRAIKVVEAGHPLPDAAGMEVAARMLKWADTAGPHDQIVCLMSGGASSLMVLPGYRITLEEKQQVTRALLESGAPIAVINRVRKAMSAIKGGRLAKAAAPLPVTTYVISDVPGDDPATVGSGPSLPDDSDPNDALAEMAAWGVHVSFDLGCLIGSNHPPQVTPGPVHMLATPRGALEAAAARAVERGLTPVILGDAIEGEAREVGTAMGGIALSVATHGSPVQRPCVLLSGGETTVTVRPRADGKRGRGGRNAEFLLGLLRATAGHPGIAALACDTDGIDGTEDNAGAWFDDTTADAARARRLDAMAFLRNHDAWGFFAALDRLIVTGPTLTNVNDFRAVLVR